MPEPDEPKPDETVIRVIIRLPLEMTGDFARLSIDSEDFIRKLEYKNTGRPENGLSILRLNRKIKFVGHAPAPGSGFEFLVA